MVYGPMIPEANARRTLTLRFDVQKLYSNSVSATTLKQSIYFENSDAFGQFLNIGLIEEISYSPAFFEGDQVKWLDKDRNPRASADVISKALKTFARYVQDVLNGRQPPWQSM
jgi:hypothetical protein